MSVEPSHLRTYKGLQALRIVAAGLVVALHSTFYARERLDNTFSLFGVGVTGVDIFFVLSGFVMIYSSSRLFNVTGGWKIFAERRIARIVPLYWIATTLKLAILLLTSGFVLHAQFSAWKTFCSYAFLPATNADGQLEPLLGVGWTLNFEMFFYLLFAIALFLHLNVYKFCGVMLGILSAAAYFRKPGWPAVSFYLNTIVLEFLLGMLIARMCLARRHLPHLVAVPLLVISFTVMLYRLPPSNAPRILVLGIPAALIVLATASLEDVFCRLPDWLVYLGDASYSIYLFHPMCSPAAPAILAKLHYVSPHLSVVVSLLMAVTVGCIAHQFVELPVTDILRNRLRVRHQLITHQAG